MLGARSGQESHHLPDCQRILERAQDEVRRVRARQHWDGLACADVLAVEVPPGVRPLVQLRWTNDRPIQTALADQGFLGNVVGDLVTQRNRSDPTEYEPDSRDYPERQ
jgi:hypothetical protein